MPEYPEMFNRAAEMRQVLTGLTIQSITVLQEKCLNIPESEFVQQVCGQTLGNTRSHGKWVITALNEGSLLINLGMGGEILYVADDAHLPEKKRVIFQFTNGNYLVINFWWFGYLHYMAENKLHEHSMLAGLGPDVMQISADDFTRLVSTSKQRIKTLLLDQKRLAGIGNFYIHDILFKAGIHPLKTANSLSVNQIQKLYTCMRADLQNSTDKGGAFYEQNLWGGKGNFSMEEIQVGYKEGTACPVCQSEIKKIQTGSTTSYFCEHCQPL
jgi:formamidopyrimidine-DNA glycosylase